MRGRTGGGEERLEVFDNGGFGTIGGGRDVTRGEVGAETLTSRENRFVTPTARPWS